MGAWKWIPGAGSGGWTKGSEKESLQLYDLNADLGETTNLAEENPEKVEEMKALMEQIITNGRSTPGPRQSNDVSVIRYPRN
jgi:arylsulfatase A-like enzyme